MSVRPAIATKLAEKLPYDEQCVPMPLKGGRLGGGGRGGDGGGSGAGGRGIPTSVPSSTVPLYRNDSGPRKAKRCGQSRSSRPRPHSVWMRPSSWTLTMAAGTEPGPPSSHTLLVRSHDSSPRTRTTLDAKSSASSGGSRGPQRVFWEP